MRTTIELDADTEAEVRRLRRDENRGVSEAVNELIRRGMIRPQRGKPFVPNTHKLGLKIDVSNISEAVDYLEGAEAR